MTAALSGDPAAAAGQEDGQNRQIVTVNRATSYMEGFLLITSFLMPYLPPLSVPLLSLLLLLPLRLFLLLHLIAISQVAEAGLEPARE